MKCFYEIEVRAQCPVNPDDIDLYQFTIETESLIEVEKIAAFFKENAGKVEVFQEALTQTCAVTLGARVTSIGWHSGIKITCHAPRTSMGISASGSAPIILGGASLGTRGSR